MDHSQNCANLIVMLANVNVLQCLISLLRQSCGCCFARRGLLSKSQAAQGDIVVFNQSPTYRYQLVVANVHLFMHPSSNINIISQDLQISTPGSWPKQLGVH